MRLAFLGTPAAAVPELEALVAAGHDIRLVVTRPDKRRGRGAATMPSPVKQAAEHLGLRVTHRVDDLVDGDPAVDVELGVVVAFGRLIKPNVLDRVPMVNVHFSLLPRWRGAAPVERAILAGDEETGVCIMQLEEGLDTGPTYASEATPITADETADELRARLVDIGTRLLIETLDVAAPTELPAPTAQTGEPTYADKIEPDELRIDWSRAALDVHRLLRIGRAWTTFRGKRLQVARAALGEAAEPSDAPPGTMLDTVVVCGDGGGIQLLEVKPEGKQALAAAAWRNGARPVPGELLGG